MPIFKLDCLLYWLQCRILRVSAATPQSSTYLGQEHFHYRAGQLGVPAKDIIKTLKTGRKDKLAYTTKINHVHNKLASYNSNDPLALQGTIRK